MIAYKYIALAIAIFLSAMLIPLPASALLLVAGALGSLGYVNFLYAFAIALTANCIGDILEFLLARCYRAHALALLESQNTRLVERIRHSIDAYAPATIFLTRFVGGIPGNILMGFADVPLWEFVLFDVLGNAVQIGTVLYLGYFGGDAAQDVVQAVSIIGWVAILLLIFVGVLIYISARSRHRR